MQKNINGYRLAKQFSILGVAAASALMSQRASAAVDLWTSTASGTSFPSSKPNNIWLNPNNWSLTAVPGPGDVAQFNNSNGTVSTLPNGNSVTLDFGDGTISTGAISDVIGATSKSPNLAFTGGSTTGTLTLNGTTVTVNVPSGTQTAGSTTETYANTILSNTDNSIKNKTLTLGSTVNIALPNATNNILGYVGVGGESTADSGFPVTTIAGNISNAGSTAAGLTFLGGGSPSLEGGELKLTGTNTFTGGLTVGNAATGSGSQTNLQGGELTVTSPSALPSVGNITINEQSQLYFSASSGGANYSNSAQTLILNGIGMGKNISGALRPKGGSAATPINWLGNIQLGTSASYDADNGAVLVTVASGGSDFKVLGNISGNNLIEQGGGTLELAGTNNTYGSTQLGNGGIQVDAGSSLGLGDVILSQTSSNSPTITLENASQTIGGLISNFTQVAPLNAFSYEQNISLSGTTLTITEPTANTVFGYGPLSGETSGINDFSSSAAGSLVYSSTSGHKLTLTGQNSYSGGTVINAGTLNLANNMPGVTVQSALGTGPVQVNNGGILASGNYTVAAGFNSGSPTQQVTGGTFTGQLNVSSGGIVSPGGGNVGFLNTGPIVADSGSIFDFSIASTAPGNYSTLNSSGGVTFSSSGQETINVTGSKFAVGTYDLITASTTLTAGDVTLVGTPGGTNRSYALSTSGTQVILTVTNTGTERDWSLGGGSPAVDGAGTWQVGSTNFFESTDGVVGATQSPYVNTDSFDTAFGNGGNGGTITLGSNVTVNGLFFLRPLATGQSYTFASQAATTNAITLGGGISASNNTTISAPVFLAGSQTWSVDNNVTLTVSGNVGESVAGSQLTEIGSGTLVLTGTGSWTGGTNVSQGTLQTTTAAVPAAGGISNSATLNFDQTTTGSYAGLISGSGNVVISNIAGTGTPSIALTNSGNTYTGSTTIVSGTLVVGNVGDLGTGDGGIVLSGGTLQASGNLLFPLNTGGSSTQKRTVTLTAGTTSTIVPAGNNIEFDSNIGGTGNLIEQGPGTLVLEGIPSTTSIGALIASGTVGNTGTIQIAQQLAGASFIFTGTASPTTGAQETGTIEITGPTLTRLAGGYFSGGGKFQVDPTGIQLIGYAAGGTGTTTTVGNTISLNPNNITGGFLTFIGADTASSLILNGPIVGNADVDFTGGAGTVVLGSTSTYTGATTIDNSLGGSVKLTVNNALPLTTDVTVTDPGVLDLNGLSQSINSLSSTHTGSASTATVTNTNTSKGSVLTITGPASTIFSGSLTDQAPTSATLGLTMNAPGGALALSGEGEYSGATNILAGRLDITTVTQDLITNGNVTGLGATSAINIGNLPGDTQAQLRFSGVNGPSGAVTIQFDPTNHPGNVTAPTITLNSLGGYTAPGSTLSTGAIRVSGSSAVILTDNIAFNQSSVISVTDTSTLQLSGQISGTGTFISQGSGTITLTGNNTVYTGGTEIDAGTFNVSTGSSIGTGPLAVNNNLNTGNGTGIVGDAVVLNLNNAAQTVASISGVITAPDTGTNTATINLASGSVLTIGSSTTTGTAVYNGVLNGAGASVVKIGPGIQNLSGGVTYTGTTTVSGGSLIFGPNTGSGIQTITSAGISVSNTGSSLVLGTASTTANRTLLVTPSVTISGVTNGWTGQIDLNNNDLIVQAAGSAGLAQITNQVKQGFAGGTWSGEGITSTAAANDANHLTALGVIENTSALGGTLYTSFDGQPASATDVLVKFTYYGDTNLDGTVDGSDYGNTDNGFLNHLTGWFNGDFNYDGVVNGSDYTLLDNAFNRQGTQISAEIATPTAQIAGAAGSSSVPEPASLGILGLTAAGLLGRRRRSR